MNEMCVLSAGRNKPEVNQWSLCPQASPVVQLNVGGHLFTTFLSTLRKHPDSKLAELFSGQPKLRTDTQGRYFLDRDGSHFGAVLEFLRSDCVPTENIQEVWDLLFYQPTASNDMTKDASGFCHLRNRRDQSACWSVCVFLQVHREALYYNIKPLIKRLEETPRLFGELVGRQQFLSRVPHYKENIEVRNAHSNFLLDHTLTSYAALFSCSTTSQRQILFSYYTKFCFLFYSFSY